MGQKTAALKGLAEKEASWHKNMENAQTLPSEGCVCSSNICTKEVFVLTSNFSSLLPQDVAMLVHSIPMKNRKRLAVSVTECKQLLHALDAFMIPQD